MYRFILLSMVAISTTIFAQSRDIVTGPSTGIFLPGERAPKDAKVLQGADIPVVGLSQPDSISVRKGLLYVANLGKKGKGFIIISDTNGGNSRKILEGMLSNPRGMGFFSDSLLLVADSPSLKVVDVQNDRVVAELAVAEAGLLNDVAIINNNTAVVSDSFKNSVYLVRFNGQTITVSPIAGLNGTVIGVDSLYYANNKIYIATSRRIGTAASGSIHTATLNNAMTSATLSTALTDGPIGGGYLSGIYVKGGKILVGDYGNGRKGMGNFYAFEEASKKQILSTGGRTGVGDFGMSEDDWLYIPEVSRNKVIRLHNPIDK
ncbi:MAG: hypothetical protein ACRCY4_05570 [Brevinema sp.]